MQKKRKRANERYPIGSALLALLAVLAVLAYQQRPLPNEKPLQAMLRPTETTSGLSEKTSRPQDDPDEPLPTTTPTPTTSPVSLEITAVGDLLMHRPISDGALVPGSEDDPEYDFRPNFAFIKPSIERADVAIYNLETTLAGPPYTGFPLFSAPDEIGTSLMDTGFNVVSTANNHILDRGAEGFERTTRVLREQGYEVIGTRLQEDEPLDVIMEMEGHAIGLAAYTFETIGTPEQPTLNGLSIPENIVPLLNSFNPYRSDQYQKDLAAMTDHVADMRARGAQLVCFVLHWGEEYQTKSRPYQQEMAQALVDAGVDIIFGHHPHVLQEIDVLQAENSNRQGLVFYSLGNLVTNMTYHQLGLDGLTQDGMIARVHLTGDGQELWIEKAEYIPTHVVQASDQGRTRHYVVPVLQGLEDPQAFFTERSILEASLQRTEKILSELPEGIEITQAAR